MASCFKISLPPMLISYKKCLETGDKSIENEEHDLLIQDIQEKIDSYINFICVKDNKENIKDLQEKTRALDRLCQTVSSVIEVNVSLKNKTETIALNNDILKVQISTISTEIADLEESVALCEKGIVDRKQQLKYSYNINRCVYNLYKKYTCCEITMESSEVARVQFPGFYFLLHSKNWRSDWALIHVKPEVEDFNKLQDKLTETDDLQAALVCLYKACYFTTI